MRELLTSKENAVIKKYRKLSESRKAREEAGLFVMEGLRLCRDAAESGVQLETLFLSPNALRYEDKLESLLRSADRIYEISAALEKHLGDTEHPQGIFAIGRLPEDRAEKPKGGRLLLLDHIQDPGNLGTLIRTAESMGVDTLVLSEGSADPFSPKVIRSTMGSAFRQKLYHAGDLAGFVEELERGGMPVYAATLTPDAVPLQKLPEREDIAVVIGNEGSGVTPEVIARCGGQVYIPMAGKAESLNAAVAGALCMWQIAGRYLV